MVKSIKSIAIDNVRYEVKRRLTEQGFKIITKSTKKFWAIKPVSEKEVKSIIKQITVLLEVADLDGGLIKPVLKFSYALLNEHGTNADGISIEI